MTLTFVPYSQSNPSAPPTSSDTTTSYAVTFNTQGGSSVASQSITSGGKVAQPTAPTRDGYTFTGWYADSACTIKYDFTTPVTGNLTLYAGWTENTVTPPAQFPFTDVSSNDWFYGDVAYMYANSLMNGTSDTQFSPNMTITRGMIVTILYRMAGSPSVSGSNPFADVPDGQYYTDAVSWAVANGIVSGYDNGKFGPSDNITREQLAAMLYRYEQFSGNIPSGTGQGQAFTDGSSISGYATDAVNALTDQGIINGKPGNLFDPQGTATRAEAAAMIHRYLESV